MLFWRAKILRARNTPPSGSQPTVRFSSVPPSAASANALGVHRVLFLGLFEHRRDVLPELSSLCRAPFLHSTYALTDC